MRLTVKPVDAFAFDNWHMSRSKRQSQKRENIPVVVGVAWYSPSQWKRLREVSADPNQLEQTHHEWVATYERTTRELAAQGLTVVKAPIAVSELEKWCRERNLTIDGAARGCSRLAAER